MDYFIGIKGSGMGPLACIMHDLGHEVAGSDIDKYIFTQAELEKRGIPVYSFDKNNIKDGYHVIIGNAFDETNPEVAATLANPKVTYDRYFEFLGKFMDRYESISIAGTHGKTTTTGMAYHVFKDFAKTSVLIGDGVGHGLEGSQYFIAESCEYQDHFHYYYPKYAIINNIELDHVDYFHNLDNYIKSFEKFANQVKDTVIVWGDDKNIKKLKIDTHVLRFGLDRQNDVVAKNYLQSEDGIHFDVLIHGELFGHFNLPFYGDHMLYNSLAIIALGYLENMDATFLQEKLATFRGTNRRYTVQEIGANVYVDDYAHHPTAINYVIEATRSRYPGKKIVGIFQPDRFSRGLEFKNEFAAALEKCDYPYFVPFPDNAKKEPGIDIDIYDIAKLAPRAKVIEANDQGAQELSQYEGVVFLFMSSKDIYKLKDKVIDLKK